MAVLDKNRDQFGVEAICGTLLETARDRLWVSHLPVIPSSQDQGEQRPGSTRGGPGPDCQLPVQQSHAHEVLLELEDACCRQLTMAATADRALASTK